MKKHITPARRPSGPSIWPIYAVVGTAAIACYVNALGGEFVHDDIPAVVLNRDVGGKRPVLDVFRNDFWGTPMADPHSHKSYRPLTTLTFRLNHLVCGPSPFWFHLANVILHAIASMLFTRACLDVARLEAPFATVAGLLFAVHPVHTEAVTGVVGRADVLAGVLFLLSLINYNKLRTNDRGNHWIPLITGGLSMLAKETGITVFLVNCAFDFFKNYHRIKTDFVEVRWTSTTKQFMKRTVINIISFGILVVLRLSILQGSLPSFSEQDNPAAFHPSLRVRTMTFCYLAALNWWLLLCPATLSHDWQMGSVALVTSPEDSRNLLTCLCFVLALLLCARSASAIEHQASAAVVLGVAMLVLPFLPATNLFVTVGFVIAERILYIPSMGSILLVTTGLRRLWHASQRHRQTLFSCLLLMLICQSLRCVVRNRDWKSRESLLRAGIATLPHNAKMHYNYGNFLKDSGHYELAMAHYYTALRLWPTYASAHNNLGTLLKEPTEAEKHFKLAIRFSKDHLNAHYNLGKMYRTKNTSKSLEMLQACLEIDVNFKPAFVELCRLNVDSDALEGRFLKKIVDGNRHDYEYYKYYAQWLQTHGNFKLAYKYFVHSGDKISSSMISSMKILRHFGCHGRLFQLITRYQTIHRTSTGVRTSFTNAYLRRWHLNRALVYRENIPAMKNASCSDI